MRRQPQAGVSAYPFVRTSFAARSFDSGATTTTALLQAAQECDVPSQTSCSGVPGQGGQSLTHRNPRSRRHRNEGTSPAGDTRLVAISVNFPFGLRDGVKVLVLGPREPGQLRPNRRPGDEVENAGVIDDGPAASHHETEVFRFEVA